MTVTLERAAPVDNLIRSSAPSSSTIALRAADGGTDGRTLFGHFAVFDTWTEINSMFEGRFLERIGSGAFKDTFRDQKSQIRVIFQHGRDPHIGDKPLGAPDVLREDERGAYYESELFDAPYVNELIPALRAGQLGASFRFRVTKEEWVEPKRATDHNPERLPERTLRGVHHFEHGPVTWGAYSDATAGVRSGTDDFIESLMTDPRFVARFTERAGLKVVEKILSTLPFNERSEDDAPESEISDEPDDVGSTEEIPDATDDDQTEGNRNQIAAALARFRHQTPKGPPDVDQ